MENINSKIPICDYGGDGHDLYFLHANGYPPDCYQPLLERLSERYHTNGLKLRPLWDGHQDEKIQDWQPLSDDLNQFIKPRSGTPAIIVGHSLGAVVGLRSAIQDLVKFRALVLIDPVIFPSAIIHGWRIVKKVGLGHQLHPLIPSAQKRRRRFDSPEAVYKAYRRKKIFRYISDKNLKIMISGMIEPIAGNGYQLAYSPEWEVQIYYSGISSDEDLWNGLPRLKTPLLIIRGSETDTFFPQTARLVKKILPTARIETLEKSTHLVPLEKPEEVAKIIINFLETVP
jgi:pimeloyl-ACP methyl ester carboxylesterase